MALTTFVLVRPSFLGNIGSVARVLKNFGFTELRLVAPPKNYKDAEARKMSLGAFDLLKNAKIYETLSDALKDVNYSVGTSCGTQRENELVSLEQLPQQLSDLALRLKKVAFVFGEERDGLTKDELNRCDVVVSIPTDPNFASLNVSHAIGIFAYELRKLISIDGGSSETNSVAPESITAGNAAETSSHSASYPSSVFESPDAGNASPAIDSHSSAISEPEICASSGDSFSLGQQDDELFVQLDLLLHEVGFSRTFNRESVLAELRRLYQRAKPTERENGMLQGMLRKISSKLNAPS